MKFLIDIINTDNEPNIIEQIIDNNFKINYIMETQLNQSASIYYNGKKCQFIKWETLSLGQIKVKISNKYITVNISELYN